MITEGITMTLAEMIDKSGFETVVKGNDTDKILSKVFCCDLLSFAMSRNPADSVWITVMGNVNTIAVAVLTDGGCIVLAENAVLDDVALKRAEEQGVTVLRTSLPVFDAGLLVHNLINQE